MQKLIAFTFVYFGLTHNAIAEVCDKISENWRDGDAPLNSLTRLYTDPLPLIFLSSFIFASIFRIRRWLQINVVLFSLPVLIYFLAWSEPDELQAYAQLEGCMEAPHEWVIMIPASFAVISAILIWFSTHKGRDKTIG